MFYRVETLDTKSGVVVARGPRKTLSDAEDERSKKLRILDAGMFEVRIVEAPLSWGEEEKGTKNGPEPQE